MIPGLYRLSAGGPGNGWFIDSAIVDGQDTLDFPFEVKPGAAPSGAVITFTDKQAQLTGTITNQRGATRTRADADSLSRRRTVLGAAVPPDSFDPAID